MCTHTWGHPAQWMMMKSLSFKSCLVLEQFLLVSHPDASTPIYRYIPARVLLGGGGVREALPLRPCQAKFLCGTSADS